jgi:hypothetical protein
VGYIIDGPVIVNTGRKKSDGITGRGNGGVVGNYDI